MAPRIRQSRYKSIQPHDGIVISSKLKIQEAMMSIARRYCPTPVVLAMTATTHSIPGARSMRLAESLLRETIDVPDVTIVETAL